MRSLLVAILVGALSAAGPAYAGSADHGRARAALAAGEVLTRQESLDTVAAAVAGGSTASTQALARRAQALPAPVRVRHFQEHAAPGTRHARFAEICQQTHGAVHFRITAAYHRFQIVSQTASFAKVAYCEGRAISCQFGIGKNLRGGDVHRRCDHEIPGLLRLDGGQDFTDPLGPGRMPVDEDRHVRSQLESQRRELGEGQPGAP